MMALGLGGKHGMVIAGMVDCIISWQETRKILAVSERRLGRWRNLKSLINLDMIIWFR
jgi:hypothetical protein